MHYLLSDQSYYFPTADEQACSLQQLLHSSPLHLPMVVRPVSSNVDDRPIKNLLSRKIPLLLLSTYQFKSILCEYYGGTDARPRSALSQGKLFAKKVTNYHTMKKLSKSLITITPSDLQDENSDDDRLNTSATLVRSWHEKQAIVVPLCRVPYHYRGYFELLNENDQAVEAFRRVSDLLIVECHADERHRQVRTEKWPQAFYLRSRCQAYTTRGGLDDGKLSGSADSCYGSLSDLDPLRTPLVLRPDKYLLQPGQLITIISACLAYRSETGEQASTTDSLPPSSATTAWLKNKSRMFFPRRKSNPSVNQPLTDAPVKDPDDLPKLPQPFLKCQTEDGDTVYISAEETGLFSPIYSPNRLGSSVPESENIDVSGVFQLKQLLSSFRFPISVRSLNHSINFEHIYSPANTTLLESIALPPAKLRLLLPYTEDVIFACPLVVPSSLKSHITVIPLPIGSEIQLQRCLNMHEVAKNAGYHQLIEKCADTIYLYQTELSYIHFPLVLNAPTRRSSSRQEPLFKKRSRSETNIERQPLELSQEACHQSSDTLNDGGGDERMKRQRESVKSARQSSAHHLVESRSRDALARQSAMYHANLKIDKPTTYSRQQEAETDDENYRDVDHIYDYIRSGDVTDDVQKIQAKEQAFNVKANQQPPTSRGGVSTVPQANSKRLERQLPPRCDGSQSKRIQRFSVNLDDSRPLEGKSRESAENGNGVVSHAQPSVSRQDSPADPPQPKPIIKMKRLTKQ